MESNGDQKVLAVVGPTAVGKSRIAQRLAIELAGELISADSMQIYKYMDIGTDKPSLEDREVFSYHCVDLIEPFQAFSVAQYQKEARKSIGEIIEKGFLPVIVGGTGLYLRAAFDKLYFPSGHIGSDIRKYLEKQASNGGTSFLYELLVNLDPEAASKIHPNNYRRVIRALEVIYQTGTAYSDYHNEWEKYESFFDLEIIGLFMKREKLYKKIEDRVDEMINKGFVDEVKKIMTLSVRESFTAQQALGYSQIMEYIEGKRTLDDAVEEIKARTRQYAKRQITWFRKDLRIRWFDVGEYNPDDIMQQIYEYLVEVNFI